MIRELKDKNLYYVGGVVRDELLGAGSFDTDFCYEGDAIKFAEENFKENIIKTNPDFGTVRIEIDGKEIDIASTREESYPQKGHLPRVYNIGCPLFDDLKRRDFTINSMAKNTLTGEIIDPYNGKGDIEKKQIRVLHSKSFIDDPTRIVRALKFSVRFGFELETATLKLQKEYLDNINYDMSYHRLKKELVETFNLNRAEAFDIFVREKIYKLLGENQKAPIIEGKVIQKTVSGTPCEPWIIYLGMFNLEKLPLTRYEKRIVDWAKKLETEPATNNTPPESLLLHKLIRT